MLNKSQSNNPSLQVTESLYEKDKIQLNLYILDSFPMTPLATNCLEQSKVWTVSFAFWLVNFRS